MVIRSRRQRGGGLDEAESAYNGAKTAYEQAESAYNGAKTAYEQAESAYSEAKTALIEALKNEIESLRGNDSPDKSRIDELTKRLDELEPKPDDETLSVGVGGRRRRRSRRSRRPRKSRRSRRSRKSRRSRRH